jgi:ABC-type transport system substrate-binding protein
MFTDTGFLNPGGGTTDRIMEIHQAALAELDPELRAELFREFSQIYVDEALNISLHYMAFPYAHRDGVIGIENLFDVRPMDIRGIGLAVG